jgi:VIT1/CCC1 family predicted Fe2+/Mn2+ transporter
MATKVHSQDDVRERSTGELVKQLSEQSSTLVRQEIELAKAELTEKAKYAGLGSAMALGAALLAMFAFGALTAALILVLAIVLDAWAAALIVGLAYAGIATGVAFAGKRQVEEAMPPAPEQTVESVKEDVQWAKTRAKSGAR